MFTVHGVSREVRALPFGGQHAEDVLGEVPSATTTQTRQAKTG